MKTAFLVLLVVVFVFFVIGNLPQTEPQPDFITNPVNEENPPAWRSPFGDETAYIGRAMVKNGIKGCGEYHVKRISPNLYGTACTRDGKNWEFYIINPIKGETYGPGEDMRKKYNLTPPY